MQLQHILCALIVAIIWASNYVAMKIACQSFPPLLATSIRMLIVAILLSPYLKKRDLSLKKIFNLSMSYNVCHLGLLIFALSKNVPVSTSVICIQLKVPITTLLGAIFLGDKPKLQQIIGMVISFVGLLITIGSPHMSGQYFALIIILFSAFFWALSNIQIKEVGTFSVIPFLAWSSLMAAPVLFVLSMLLEPVSAISLNNLELKSIIAVFYTSLTTIIGYSLWCYLLQLYSVNIITPFSLLVPILGVIASKIFLDELLSWHIFAGGIVTLLGVGIILITKNKTSNN